MIRTVRLTITRDVRVEGKSLADIEEKAMAGKGIKIDERVRRVDVLQPYVPSRTDTTKKSIKSVPQKGRG